MTTYQFPSLFKTLVLLVACAASAVGGGCQTTYSSHQLGDQRVVARYGGRSLHADLPRSIRVPAVIAAADGVARSRGYSVLKSEATEEVGRISSTPPGKDSVQRVVVHASKGDHGTEIRVSYEPFPDRRLCESILDAILATLSASPEPYTK